MPFLIVCYLNGCMLLSYAYFCFIIVASNSLKHKLPTGTCNTVPTHKTTVTLPTTITTTRSTDLHTSTLVTTSTQQTSMSTSAKTNPTTTGMNSLI